YCAGGHSLMLNLIMKAFFIRINVLVHERRHAPLKIFYLRRELKVHRTVCLRLTKCARLWRASTEKEAQSRSTPEACVSMEFQRWVRSSGVVRCGTALK